MTPTKSKQLVLVSSIVLIGVAVYREQQGQPGSLFKRVWGVGALAVMLSLLADFAPAVAGPFAALTVLGALTHGGDQALVNLTSGAQAGVAKVTGTGPGPGAPAGVQGPVGKPSAAPAPVTAPPGVQGPVGSSTKRP